MVDPVLSAVARRRLLDLAATVLGELPEADVPKALQRVRQFAPGRRPTAGAGPLAAALEHDSLFRSRVATALRDTEPELVAALDDGAPAAADPADVEVAAYLVRPDGWQQLLGRSAPGGRDESSRVERLRTDLEKARVDVQAARERATALNADLQDELVSVKRELRRHRSDADRARAQARDALAAAAQTADQARAAEERADTRATRAERELAAATESLQALRRAGREGRSLAGSRARLLLDTLVDAASGLRHELALPPVDVLPADVVAADAMARDGAPASPVRARSADDPALLDELLSLPGVHLVVDGYNVTRGAYDTLPLVDQRRRLVTGLAALAARTRIEITCVFDGAALEARVAAPSVRGVRVLFSAPDEIADELIRRLVRAEPRGRVVVVVSSDREVADGVLRSGARPVPSTALARLLARG